MLLESAGVFTVNFAIEHHSDSPTYTIQDAQK